MVSIIKCSSNHAIFCLKTFGKFSFGTHHKKSKNFWKLKERKRKKKLGASGSSL
jgi:hypothetical protein